MRVTVLTSDTAHPVYARLLEWARVNQDIDVQIVTRKAEALGGDILFLISCHEVVAADIRARYQHTLVIHASDLPRGRGWSPMIWAVVAGAREITVTLLEAVDRVDAGAIWLQERIQLEGHELYDELNELLFSAELRLMTAAVRNAQAIKPRVQDEAGATYYPRRTPADSRLDPQRTLAEQFDLLRVCDPQRYPAFFELRGQRYEVRLTKKQD